MHSCCLAQQRTLVARPPDEERLWKIIRPRLRDCPECRTEAEIKTLLERIKVPHGCPEKMDKFVTDLIYRDRWRPEWGEKPS